MARSCPSIAFVANNRVQTIECVVIISCGMFVEFKSHERRTIGKLKRRRRMMKCVPVCVCAYDDNLGHYRDHSTHLGLVPTADND